MAPLPPANEYYRIVYTAKDQSDSESEFIIDIRRADYYAGDGSDMGNSTASGIQQLTAVAEGIASGIEASSAPFWNDITVKSIHASPAEPTRLYPPTSEE